MDVFVVKTPLQLLNAEEARQYFRSADAHLLALTSAFYPPDAFHRLLSPRAWRSVRCLAISNRDDLFHWRLKPNERSRLREWRVLARQLRRRAALERIARSYGAADRLFLGNYFVEFMRHFARCLPHGEVILLDDGTDTIRVNEARVASAARSVPPAPARRSDGWKRRFRNAYVDWIQHDEPAVTFFTTYELAVRPGDVLIRHEYAFLRARMAAVQPEEVVYFLGQPLAADGYLTEEAYLAAVRQVREHFTSEPFLYVAHPREENAALERLGARLDVKVTRFDSPIEVEMVRRARQPRTLASLFCSALENCAVLFDGGLDIQAFRFDLRELLCCRQDVEDIYAHFGRRPGIEIVELSPNTRGTLVS